MPILNAGWWMANPILNQGTKLGNLNYHQKIQLQKVQSHSLSIEELWFDLEENIKEGKFIGDPATQNQIF